METTRLHCPLDGCWYVLINRRWESNPTYSVLHLFYQLNYFLANVAEKVAVMRSRMMLVLRKWLSKSTSTPQISTRHIGVRCNCFCTSYVYIIP